MTAPDESEPIRREQIPNGFKRAYRDLHEPNDWTLDDEERRIQKAWKGPHGLGQFWRAATADAIRECATRGCMWCRTRAAEAARRET